MDDRNLTVESMSLDTSDNLEQTASKGNSWKSFFEILRRDKRYRRKFIKTCILCWSFVNYGITIGQFGPSLLDLTEITKTTVSQISGTITAAGIGYMLGAILTGIIGNRIHIDILCFLSCLGSSVTTFIIPWCSIFELMIVLNFLRGSMGGVLDTAGNTLLVELWGKQASSYMQTLHFSWAFGSIISPLFTAPFLSKLSAVVISNKTSSFHISNITCLQQIERHDSTSNASFCKWNNTVEIFNNTARFNDSSTTEFKLYIPYSIAAFLFMTASVCFLATYIQALCSKNRKTGKTKINLAKNSYIEFIIFNYDLCFSIFGALLATFSVTRLGWSKVDGSYITSVFSGSLCAGRFLSIAVIKFLGSSKILLIYSTILCIAVAGFLISSIFTFEVGLWLTTAVVGFFGSAIFPGILTWTEEEFVPMTRRVTSSIMVGSSIGWMTIPYVTGILMDTFSPMFFCYVSLGISMVVILIYSTAYLLSRQLKTYYKTRKNVTYVV
ncbi:LOW QUALITY PROTEIN: hypothetical protein KUTeg_008681 [Tegillarca granosa]|uniref:Uncharacterized protein n=1 Tax=Tegillarca granosa TaxID=220873 RepID=A0ABQ9F9V5_TEGGR|nr:LOW QUALITY PROTEIN: hypothetical protein KUTeg_008681 [Tegillarca granosa]